MPKVGQIVNKRELAEFFKVSVQAIDGWLARDCPYVEKGGPGVGYKFDTAAVSKWRSGVSEDTANAHAEAETLLAAQLRDLQAAADLKELKRDQLRGELLEAGDAEKAWGGMVSATRSAFLLLPAKLAPRVSVVSDVRECQAIIEKEVRAALSGLSEYQPNE